MDVFLILAFLFVLLVSYGVLTKRKGLPPGPFALPFVGCLSIMKKLPTMRPHLVFYKASRKYGNIMSIKIGRELIIVLSGSDVIHQALVKQADTFSDRPTHLPGLQAFRKHGGGVIFENYNHKWRTMRRFTLQTLRDFGVGKSSIEDKIMAEISASSKVFLEKEGQPMMMAPLLQNVVGNIIYGIIFGHRYDYEDPEFEMVRNFTNSIIRGQGPVSPTNFFPAWLVKLFLREDEAELKRREEMGDAITYFMLEKIKEHEDTYDGNNIRDFIDLYIQASRENKDEHKDTFTSIVFDLIKLTDLHVTHLSRMNCPIFIEGNMLRMIEDLFLAGSETSSTTLDWAFLFMIENPAVQKRCQDEIEEVVGDKPVAYADRTKLTYVEATIMEIQRLANIVPLSVMHRAINDTELQEYKIPQGSIIIPLLYSASYDPKYWVDAETFNPDRFINTTGKLIKNDALMPFSVGPRTCLGEPLAKMELFLVFANLLQKFTFSREDKTVKHSLKPKESQITNSPAEYKLCVQKR